MRRILFLIFVLIVAVFGVLIWSISQLSSLDTNKAPKRFVITKGETASQIGKELESQHIIKSGLGFRIYAQVSGLSKDIKSGSYEISSNLGVPDLINKFLAGPTEVWVTIPEGLRREEIAKRFADGFDLTGKQSSEFQDEFLRLTAAREGYLFPDTYLFSKEATPKQVADLMEKTFNTQVDFKIDTKTLILASIIERETLETSERPIVAGILLKRLSASWPIQADATIQYALGNSAAWWKPVTLDDLKIDSSYNTYKNLGLPPTSICNPGLSSIKAAANPQDSNYWYYIHDKDGQIHYAETLDEQNANISHYLQ